MSQKSELEGLQKNILLTNHTTFRIGGPAKYFFEAKTKKDILDAVNWARRRQGFGGQAKQNSLPYFILGGGSNLLVSDEGFDGLIIKVQSSKFNVQSASWRTKFKIINAEAGVPLARLVVKSIDNGLTGLEWAAGIPGTIGGAICGNAGAHGHRISEVVLTVQVLGKSNKIKKFNNQECQFGYRRSIFKKNAGVILSVKLKLKEGNKEAGQEKIRKILLERRHKIPPFPSAGSIFKNLELKRQNEKFQKLIPPGKIKNGMVPTGYLIERCGLKGKQIGDAKISNKHANFIVNVGRAKAKDVIALINLCKKSVKEKFGIKLEEEIRYLGFPHFI